MTQEELIEKVDRAFEMVININGKKFTICDENERGYSIAEWYRQETEMHFSDANVMVSAYMIDGKPLGDYAPWIQVEDYTGL